MHIFFVNFKKRKKSAASANDKQCAIDPAAAG